jgi:hypothetical protein
MLSTKSIEIFFMINFGICTETQFSRFLRTMMNLRRKEELIINTTLGKIKTLDSL